MLLENTCNDEKLTEQTEDLTSEKEEQVENNEVQATEPQNELVEECAEKDNSCCEEECLEEETVEEEYSEDVPTEVKYFSDEQFGELKNMMKLYFEALYKTVNNVKSKDESIYNINKDLQKAKNDYYLEMCKPLVGEVIQLREGFKKTVQDMRAREFTKKRVLSDLEFSIEEFENVLNVYEVSIVDGEYFYQSNKIYPSPIIKCLKNEEKVIDIETSLEPLGELDANVKDINGLMEIFNLYQKRLETVFANNEIQNKTINVLHNSLKQQQAACNGRLLIPLLDKVILKLEHLRKMYLALEQLEDEQLVVEKYNKLLEDNIAYFTQMLESVGVYVYELVDDEVDPRYYRILKMIKIENEDEHKDKSIERLISDCYMYQDRVLFHGKVSIYKLQ